MLCSARELGLGEEHDGIMELPASLPLNSNVREALDLDDTVLEVNATPESRRLHERVRHRARLRRRAGAPLPQGERAARARPRTTRSFPVRIESRSRLSACSARA